MEYKVLEALSSSDLSSIVTGYLERGWVLHGSPFTVNKELTSNISPRDYRHDVYCQAVIFPSSLKECPPAAPEKILLKD